MIPISLEELLNVIDGELLAGKLDTEFSGYTTDTRTVEEGQLFIPLVGENFNGNDFIEKAFNSGAAVCMISDLSKRPLEIDIKNKTLIFVKDSLVALQRTAAYLLIKADIPVVAVTGSTGKTTTKEMISSVLDQNYVVLKNEGNLNNHIGLPLTLLKLTEEHEIAILEMGMSGLDEIKRLSAIAQPQIGVITNIGESHIENLGSKEGIRKAKMEITSFMKKDDLLIVNGDDPYLTMEKDTLSVTKIMVGEGSNCDLNLKSYTLNNENGSVFKVNYHGNLLEFRLQVPGYHNIQNALLAIAVGLHLGLDLDEVKRGITKYEGSKMRLNIYEVGEKIRVIDDAYNASPDSMKAALAVLGNYKHEKKIAVLGDMLEMGEFGVDAHKLIGTKAQEYGVDYLFLYGDMMEYAVKTACEAGITPNNIVHSTNRETLSKKLIEVLEPDSVILFKGSRGMEMEYFIGQVKESVNLHGDN